MGSSQPKADLVLSLRYSPSQSRLLPCDRPGPSQQGQSVEDQKEKVVPRHNKRDPSSQRQRQMPPVGISSESGLGDREREGPDTHCWVFPRCVGTVIKGGQLGSGASHRPRPEGQSVASGKHPGPHSLPSPYRALTGDGQGGLSWGMEPGFFPPAVPGATHADANLGLQAAPRGDSSHLCPGTCFPCDQLISQVARIRGQVEMCALPPLSSWGPGRCDRGDRMQVQVDTFIHWGPTPSRAEGRSSPGGTPDLVLLARCPRCLLRVVGGEAPGLSRGHPSP